MTPVEVIALMELLDQIRIWLGLLVFCWCCFFGWVFVSKLQRGSKWYGTRGP